jgi:cytidine deaminase
MNDDQLYEQALAATAIAYPVHSGLYVGAVLEAEDGTLITGGNIEFGSYGLTICDGTPISPCGMCRQSLVDFGPLDVVYRSPGGIVKVSIMDLLPDAFLFGEDA